MKHSIFNIATAATFLGQAYSDAMILTSSGTNTPPFRSSGQRAHKKWKKRRASGRAK